MPPGQEVIEISFVQSVFLRDVVRIFGGSTRDFIISQYERNMLVSLCRTLNFENDLPHVQSNSAEPTLDSEWHRWLFVEERLRILHCTYSKLGLK